MYVLKNKNEIVLGYMHKKPIIELEDNWSFERRLNYLLITSISAQLSVDSGVWCDIGKDQKNSFNHDIVLFEEFKFDNSETVLISMMIDEYRKLFEYCYKWSIYIPKKIMLPTDENIEIDFLGYDLVDSMYVSGLANCAYTPQDKIDFIDLLPFLNSHGLITNINAAKKMQILTDQRVKEHAPFSILGMYKLSKIITR